MKKKYENFWNMFSNCFNTIKAFAQKKISNSPSKKKKPMSKSYILLRTQFTGTVLLLIKGQPVTVEKYHAQYSNEEA